MQDTGELLRQTSIIVCTTDRFEDLARCLESLQCFRGTGAEIVVVNNGPAQSSVADIAASSQARVALEPRLGVSRARNAGIREARGTILAFLDDDSVADSNWLPLLLAPLEDRQVAGVVGSIGSQTLADPVSQALHTLHHAGFPTSRVVLEAGPEENVFPLRLALVGNGNMAIRREAFAHFGGFDERLGRGTRIGSGEEPDLLFRLLRGGARVVVEPAACILHRHSTQRRAVGRWAFRSGAAHTAILTKYFLQEPALRGAIWRYVRNRTVRRGVGPESTGARPGALPRMPFLAGSLYGPFAWFLSRRQIL